MLFGIIVFKELILIKVTEPEINQNEGKILYVPQFKLILGNSTKKISEDVFKKIFCSTVVAVVDVVRRI